MASSYFTRPFGLRPTPSACFPPPPPPLRGNITGTISVSPNPIQILLAVAIHWNQLNHALPVGDIGNVLITTPNGSMNGNHPFQNGMDGFAAGHWTLPAGFHSGTARFTWSNGQVRTRNFTYTTLP